MKFRDNVPFQSKGGQPAEILLTQRRSVFVLTRLSTNWMRSTHIREVNVFYSKPTNLHFNLNPEISKIMLYQLA